MLATAAMPQWVRSIAIAAGFLLSGFASRLPQPVQHTGLWAGIFLIFVFGAVSLHHLAKQTSTNGNSMLPVLGMAIGALIFIACAVRYFVDVKASEASTAAEANIPITISAISSTGAGFAGFVSGPVDPAMFTGGPVYITNLSRSRPLTLDIKALLTFSEAAGPLRSDCDGLDEVTGGKVGVNDEMARHHAKFRTQAPTYLPSPLHLSPQQTVAGSFACLLRLPESYPALPKLLKLEFEITDAATGHSIRIGLGRDYQGTATD